MEHCGAIMRADCEVRMGTVSEGMSKVSEVISTSKEGGGQGYLRGFISELRFHCQRVIPSSVHGQADKSPLQCSSMCRSPCKRPRETAIPDSHSSDT